MFTHKAYRHCILYIVFFSLNHQIHGLLPTPYLTPSLLREAGDLKIILSDIDGTLLSTKHRLSQPTYDAIQRARTSNYLFYPCTGRSRTSMNNAEPQITSLFGGLLRTPGVYQQGITLSPTHSPTYLLPYPLIH